MRWIGNAGIAALVVVLMSSCSSEVAGPNPDPGSETLTIDVTDATWVAYQDGEGSWTFLTRMPTATARRGPRAQAADRKAARTNKRVATQSESEVKALAQQRMQRGELTQLSEKTVTISDPRGRYGVASVCEDVDTGEATVFIEHGTLGEGDYVFAGCFFDDGETPSYSVSGTVSGLGVTDFAYVEMGYRSEPVAAVVPSYSFALDQDTYDLVATKFSNALVPTKMFVSDDLEVDSDTVVDIDFDAGEAFVPELRSLSIEGATNESELFGDVTAWTENYTFATVGIFENTLNAQYALIPEPYLFEDGLYDVFVSEFSDLEATTSTYRYLSESFLPTANKTVALPTPFGSANVTSGGGGRLNPSASWDAYAGENVSYEQTYLQFDGDAEVFYYVTQTSGWFDGSGAQLRYTLPDLRSLQSWQQRWELSSEVETLWSVGAGTRRGNFDEDGYTSTWVGRDGSLFP